MPSCAPFEDTTTTIGIEGVNGKDEWEECKRHYLLFYCCTRIIIQRRCEKAEDMRQRMIGRIVGLSVIILLLYTYNNTANWMRGGRGE
jgi:hypothetical protein